MTWRYICLKDVSKIVNALLLSEFVLIALIYYVNIVKHLTIISNQDQILLLPRSIIVIDAIITLILIFSLRILKRVYIEQIRNLKIRNECNTIVIGAGNTGEMVVRDISRQKESKFKVIGFLDDNTNKIGSYINGIKVIGETKMLAQIGDKYTINNIIIAIPNLHHKELKKIYDMCRQVGVKTIKIVPRIYDIDNIKLTVNSLEDIKIEDILGRQIVNIDFKDIETSLISKRILITGACGSIGSELVKQIYSFHPIKMILFDIDETDMYNMQIKLEKHHSYIDEHVAFVIGDIKDKERLAQVFNFYKPNIVFHAAAYKHVPMMEHNPLEAVKVNIFGTYNLAQASIKFGVEKFILISTDKAINPNSVMGSTKQISEIICKALDGTTKFISVRFGNVLGSRGSVLPLFLEQLREGGPLTVTHENMKRYFMTIPEAVSLVLQASVIGNGGDVLLLNMGEPISILYIAEELIKLHGLEPYKDIDIKIVGIRPGEKIFEELFNSDDIITASKHERIFIIRGGFNMSHIEIEKMLNDLNAKTKDMLHENHDLIKKYLQNIVLK
ncbi:MAG: polysaccharide biosynthesis protein [Nitrospirae bacterium]|nr:polysaccharide biosynthesis protein [Nitrospirota bacterium]